LYHMRCLRRTMTTLHRTFRDPARTLITVENPCARFKDLPLVQACAARPGWRMHTADHCSMLNHLDGETLFPRKPTSWLVFGDLPSLGTLPRCNGSCSCMIPGTSRHKMVICNNPNMHPEQVRIDDVLEKGRIPLGAFDRFWRAHTHVAPTPSSDCDCAGARMHSCMMAGNPDYAFPATRAPDIRAHLEQLVPDSTEPTAPSPTPSPTPAPTGAPTNTPAAHPSHVHEVHGEKVHAPVEVKATLLPPTHIIREHAPNASILWHRRFGHRLSRKIHDTSKHVLGLARHRDPAFCQCCAQTSMQAKSRTNKHYARRPQAHPPLSQVSADIVEYSSESFGPILDMHGCKFAVVFIDGYSRYSYVVPIKRKSDALWAFKRFVQDVGKPRELLTDCDSVFLGAPFST
jgi:hypothetical protein